MRLPAWIVLCGVLSGCPNVDGPGRYDQRFSMLTPDLASDFGALPIDEFPGQARSDWGWSGSQDCRAWGLVIERPGAYQLPDGTVVGGERAAAVEAAFRDGLSLIRVADGAIVPAELRDGCFDVRGARGSEWGDVLSLVPSAPLEDGWYVLRADLSAVRAMGFDVLLNEPREGDVRYARVRIGSAPSWTANVLECDAYASDRCVIHAMLSEPVDAAVLEAATLRVAFAGVDAVCVLSRWDWGLIADCPEPPEGAEIAITLESATITRPSGAPPGTVTVPYAEATASHADRLWLPVEPDFALALARDGARL